MLCPTHLRVKSPKGALYLAIAVCESMVRLPGYNSRLSVTSNIQRLNQSYVLNKKCITKGHLLQHTMEVMNYDISRVRKEMMKILDTNYKKQTKYYAQKNIQQIGEPMQTSWSFS